MIIFHFHLQPHVQIWIIFKHTSHPFTPHGKIWTQSIDLATNVWLHSSVGRALHQYPDVKGLNPVETLIFFRLLLSNCLSWKIYGHSDDHSSLSSTTAVQVWIISYIIHILPLLTGKCELNQLTLPPMCGLPKLENLLQWSFFTFIYRYSSNMNYFI